MQRYSHEKRRYSVPYGQHNQVPLDTCEDLHAWSIYRQNLNSDFTDTALKTDKSPLPYGNFQLKDATVQTILTHPRYGPQSPLGSNIYTYLKFGLPRVFPLNLSPQNNKNSEISSRRFEQQASEQNYGSSGYDSSENEQPTLSRIKAIRRFRSESDFQTLNHVRMDGSRTRNRQKQIKPQHMMHRNGNTLKSTHTHHQGHDLHVSNYQRSQSEGDILKAGYDNGYMREMQPQENGTDSKIHTNIRYPVFEANNISVEKQIKGVSIQVMGGDLTAVMATSAQEGTLLLKAFAGLRRVDGGFIAVNGHKVNQNVLRKICSYVPSSEEAPFHSNLDVQSTLYFHAKLKKSPKGLSIKEQVIMLATCFPRNIIALLLFRISLSYL